MKKVAFHTLGCKVNQVETEQMKEDFISRGYQVVDFNEPADVYVVNTCTVTHISDRKSRAMLRRAARTNPSALVVATGCVTQVAAEQLAGIEGVDLLIGNRDKENVAAIVDSFDRRAGIKRFIELPASEDKLNPIIYSRPHERTRAFVKIQDGCQSFCSYCIVPYARGPVRSKEPRHVLAEITSLVSLGYKEIVLSGIHTGFYGIDLPGWDLTRLVTLILDQVEGNYRIRLSSIEPLEVNNRLIELMAASSRICRHLHIPLQSGSDRILYSMRRRYTGSYYQELILKIAGQIPAMAFTADVMVGYPTETQVDFEASYDIIKKLPLYDLHVFKYSRRPGTTAADLQPQVDEELKQQRSAALIKLAAEKRLDFLNNLAGEKLWVLVERKIAAETYAGISDNYVDLVFHDGQDRRGEFVQVVLQKPGTPQSQGEITG